MGKCIARALNNFYKECECEYKRTGNEICMMFDGFMLVSVYVNLFLNNFTFHFCVGGYVWNKPASFNLSAQQCRVPLNAKFDRRTFFHL